MMKVWFAGTVTKSAMPPSHVSSTPTVPSCDPGARVQDDRYEVGCNGWKLRVPAITPNSHRGTPIRAASSAARSGRSSSSTWP